MVAVSATFDISVLARQWARLHMPGLDYYCSIKLHKSSSTGYSKKEVYVYFITDVNCFLYNFYIWLSVEIFFYVIYSQISF